MWQTQKTTPIQNAKIPPRYTNKPFPAYRHLPGKTPHPVVDPKGHSYGEDDQYLAGFLPEDWKDCHPYLYGIDLINNNYWWEAHEALEQVWLAAGRDTVTGTFVQGLIQVAVAQLKRFMGAESGAQKLTESGVAKLSIVDGVYLGIDVVTFVADVERCLRRDSGEYPRIILHYEG